MPTGISDLPCELRLQIFELVAQDEFYPRIVEIFRKADQLYSKTAPPPLLHVCRESRNVILKIYKPWLPQFKGTASYKHWVDAIKKARNKNAYDPFPSIKNICVSLEHDAILVRDSSWWQLDELVGYHLHQLEFNVAGWQDFSNLRRGLRRFKKLKCLYIFDDRRSGAASYKADRIINQLEREEEKDNKEPKKRIPNFRAPRVIVQYAPALPTPWVIGRRWTSYKYPKREQLPIIPRPLEPEPPKTSEMPRSKKRQLETEDVGKERPRKRAQPAPKRNLQPTKTRTHNPPYRKPVPRTKQKELSAPSSPSVTTSDELRIQLQLREELDEERSTRASTPGLFVKEDDKDRSTKASSSTGFFFQEEDDDDDPDIDEIRTQRETLQLQLKTFNHARNFGFLPASDFSVVRPISSSMILNALYSMSQSVLQCLI